MAIDTSATETEDETKQSPKRSGMGATRGRKKKLLGGTTTHHSSNNKLAGDKKQKGRRKQRRGKSLDKAGQQQAPGINRLTGFKARKNAATTAPNHKKLHIQKGPAVNTPKVGFIQHCIGDIPMHA